MNDGLRYYYICVHSYDRRKSRPRSNRNITSLKSGLACPSGILATLKDDGTVEAEYWSTHIGHSMREYESEEKEQEEEAIYITWGMKLLKYILLIYNLDVLL